jgi:hypothetical protein
MGLHEGSGGGGGIIGGLNSDTEEEG